MKKIMVALLLLHSCASLQAAESLTGTWKSVKVTADGNHVATYFDIKQQEEIIAGTVHFAWGDLPLIEGRIHGNKIHFAAHQNNAFFSYDGELVNGRLVNARSLRGLTYCGASGEGRI
jgi:hypothetical protein